MRRTGESRDLLAARSPGVLALLALASACSDGDIIEPEPPVAYVTGQVYVLPGQTPGPLVARVLWDELERGANVEPDGSFAVGLPREVTGSGVLIVEAASGAGTQVPAWTRISDTETANVRIVLTPRTWTVDGGAYDGATAALDPAGAADSRVLFSYWGFGFPYEQDGFVQTVVDSTRWLGQSMAWPNSAYPIPLILDRDGSTDPISEADSLAFWDRVNGLEAVLGQDLFVPESLDGVELDTVGGARRVPGAVMVRIDGTQTLRGRAGSVPNHLQWLWDDPEAGAWSGGSVQRVTLVGGDLHSGQVVLRDVHVFTDPGLVPHELMHALGLGHGCSWPSIQTYCESLASDVPTVQDVAHFQALTAVRRLEAALDTRHGLAAAVFGHRVVELGLPPVPPARVVFGPDNAVVAPDDRVILPPFR